MKIEFINNASGDWVVTKVDGKVFVQGHSLSNWDLMELLKYLGHEVSQKEVSDEEMESNY